MTQTLIVRTPATTANLGPGFDCIGAALTLYNQFRFSPWSGDPSLAIEVIGVEGGHVSLGKDNLVYQAFLRVYDYLGQEPPGVKIVIEMAVPLARGLGSSATAIVGGLVGANGLAGNPLSEQEVMDLAIAMEGHPDNVVPALLGGCRLAVKGAAGWVITEISWHQSILPIVAIPDFELSTAEARRVLPSQYLRQDVIFTASHLALLVMALGRGEGKWLPTAMQDCVHQPYRKGLIPGYDAVEQAAIAAGAFGLTISGAGPTLIALGPADRASEVAVAITQAWHNYGVRAEVRSLAIDHQGTTVVVT